MYTGLAYCMMALLGQKRSCEFDSVLCCANMYSTSKAQQAYYQPIMAGKTHLDHHWSPLRNKQHPGLIR